MKDGDPPVSPWVHPPARAEMLAQVNALSGDERAKRLSVALGRAGHVDDEVVVTLLLVAWRAEHADADTFAAVLVRRIFKHVRSHVRKNPAWQRLGGGTEAVADDFTQSIAMAILRDPVRPCHAEVAFGNYVHLRCLDEAGKLFAKKHSAGQSLDDEESFETRAQTGESVDSPATSRSPEELLISLEEQLAAMLQLEQIRRIVEDGLPELEQIAITFRFYGELKIASKNKDEATVASLMGISETTATKYIKQAVETIISRLQK